MGLSNGPFLSALAKDFSCPLCSESSITFGSIGRTEILSAVFSFDCCSALFLEKQGFIGLDLPGFRKTGGLAG
jgi:hypothetical protein